MSVCVGVQYVPGYHGRHLE